MTLLVWLSSRGVQLLPMDALSARGGRGGGTALCCWSHVRVRLLFFFRLCAEGNVFASLEKRTEHQRHR